MLVILILASCRYRASLFDFPGANLSTFTSRLQAHLQVGCRHFNFKLQQFIGGLQWLVDFTSQLASYTRDLS
jgi:hypothetical protein